MSDQTLLDYKRVLIVDDEPDVLETLEQLLPMCDVVRASNFEEAKALLETQYFDMAILDIMGVSRNPTNRGRTPLCPKKKWPTS